MATVSTASTHWEGSLFEGSGTTALESSGAATFDVKWDARADVEQGTTNPEELIAAALATCYSMALSNELAKNDTPPTTVDTSADVTFVPGTGITGTKVTVTASVPGLSEEQFQTFAENTHKNCPVAAALSSVPSELDATLV